MSEQKRQKTILVSLLMLFLVSTVVSCSVQAQDASTPIPEPTSESTETPAEIGSMSDNLAVMLSSISWQDVIGVAISVAVILLVAYYGGKLLYRLLRRIVRRSKNDLDNQLLEVIKPQISWFLLALGFQFATRRLAFLNDGIQQLLQTSYFLLYLLLILVTVWRAGDFLVDWYIAKNTETMNQSLVTQLVPLLKRLAHIALVLIALLIAAGYFGIDVLAISAALGLTGFALALAAKDTITNVISGFVLMVSQPFKVGDRIDVPDLGSWGEVSEIGIRSTTVIMRDNRMVIVPNSSVVDNMVVNYSRPDSTYRLESDIGIGAAVDIPEVQEMIRATVRNLDGVLPEKPVDVWFTEFADSSNTLRVRWWVASYAEKRRSTDRVNAAIQELATREKIDIPNPTYTLENKVVLDDEEVESVIRTAKGA
jgi:small-conductance mechanosensitive channel